MIFKLLFRDNARKTATRGIIYDRVVATARFTFRRKDQRTFFIIKLIP
ncbi:unnamed protein product, partial [Amoebophrya sp. A120]|eukprot:GSA120T00008612001.1